MKTACVIQCTASDLYPSRDPNDYVIGVARNCGLFDRVILAVPDVQESRIFEDLAAQWEVELCFGPVNDVTKRILAAAGQADLIARVLLKRSYMDENLVAEMIDILKGHDADYVNLPYDFNYELAADIFTMTALSKINQILLDDDHETRAKRFNPWYVMENSGEFNVITHPGVDRYPAGKVRWIKKKLKYLEENQFSVPVDSPISAYAPIEKHLSRVSKVLDVATGQGCGAIRLRKSVSQVIGLDIRSEYIERATHHATDVYGDDTGIQFICTDAHRFSRPGEFDAIVSIHTLEHLSDPPGFLDQCRENLKNNGKLFIEVPLLLPRPLGKPLYPFHQKEFLKEEIENLLTDAGFIIVRKLGRNRNFYTDIDKAREAVQYHCRH